MTVNNLPPGPTGAVSRSTRQQTAIRNYLAQTPDFHTAQQIHDQLAAQGQSVSLPTVYRVLTRLAEAGEIDQLQLAEGQAAYRRCQTREHHHHLVCRRCRTAVEISGEDLERWAAATGQRYGFTEVDHQIELFGLCRDCREATRADQSGAAGS